MAGPLCGSWVGAVALVGGWAVAGPRAGEWEACCCHALPPSPGLIKFCHLTFL